ncbi:MAG TPA: bifunctional sugar-1-phosphate nucleotidylyltransferase/acetyltransferase [archaeon]|nr:bifunctional sugar-1-phosphate nucleotidylyltransferase/acetyltransferase [archaeon]
MKIIFLAAGKGERMMPLTQCASKAMMPVANKPFIQWTMEAAKEIGTMALVCRADQQDVQSFARSEGAEIIIQAKPLGTLDALKACKAHVSGDFLLINGDCMFSEGDVKKLASCGGNAMGIFRMQSVKNFGGVESLDGALKRINEKLGEGGEGFANAGIYRFTKDVFDYLDAPLSPRGEYELTDAINEMTKRSKIKVIEVPSWITMTYPWDLLGANQAVLDARGSMIAAGAEIRSSSVIEEPVAIGEGAVIGPNAYIRKYSSIGNGCHIGNAVEVKGSVVMEGTKIPHLSYVGDSVVGRRCNLGAGFITANLRLNEQSIGSWVKGNAVDTGRKKLGAIIGDDVKAGVRVSVMPGKKIWHGIAIPAGAIIKNDLEKQPNISKMGKVI